MRRVVEESEFDRLKNEATQKVLDTLADMPDAISMLLAAKSARVSHPSPVCSSPALLGLCLCHITLYGLF